MIKYENLIKYLTIFGKNEMGELFADNDSEGIIKEVIDGSNKYQKYIIVEFKAGDKKFIFPDIFEKMLKTDSEVIRNEIQATFDNIRMEREKERLEKEKEKERIELEKAEAERALLEKKKTKRVHQNTTVIDGHLIKGQVYGTAAKDIYEAGCIAFSWSQYEMKCFGWQTPNYSEIATEEGYSVWFLAHSNWTDSDTTGVKNQIHETYLEQWWRDYDHPVATARKRLIFAKKDNRYMFLGLFKFVGKEETRVQDGITYYVERFDFGRIS